ncbi:hypothetical protein ACFLRB_05375 [Acidobacteriota bacterium]
MILNLIMAFSAYLLAYYFLKKSGFAEQLVTAFLIFAVQVTFSLLFLGVILQNLGVPAILTINLGISIIISITLRKEIKNSLGNFGSKSLSFIKFLRGSKDCFLTIFLILFIIQISILTIKIYHLPPHVSDALHYHLPPVVEWVQQEKIPLMIDTPVDRINVRALGSGLFLFWLAKLTGNTIFLELSQFFHGIILLLISYAIMLKTGVKKKNALRYALLIYFIPSVLLQSRTCQNHLILTTWILISILYLINVVYEKNNRHIILLSMSLGILWGVKLNSPQIIFVMFLTLLLSAGFKKEAAVKFLQENKWRIIIGFGILFLLGGYWHIKNMILYHNPTGPYSPGVFAFSRDSLPEIVAAMMDIFIKNVREFPIRISDSSSYYIAGLARISGFGFQFFVFGLISYIGIFFLIIKKRIKRNSVVGFFWMFSVLLLTSYFLYYYDLFNHRLFLFFPVIGIILWAYLSAHLRLDTGKLFSTTINLLITVMLLFNMAACFFTGYSHMTFKWKTLFSSANARDRTTIKYFPYFKGISPGEWQIIDRYVAPKEPIGYFGDRHSLLFQYYDNKMTRRIYHVGSLPGYERTGKLNNYLRFSPEFKTSLIKRNIRFIHINFPEEKVCISDRNIDHISGGLYYYRWNKKKGEH